MKKLLFFSLVIISLTARSQQINNSVYGQNANLTNKVGVNLNAGGKLDCFWGDQSQSSCTGLATANLFQKSVSGVAWVRYSGEFQEKNLKLMVTALLNRRHAEPRTVLLRYVLVMPGQV